MEPLAIGICSWSIDRHRPLDALRTAAGDLGVRAVHLGFFDEETLAATTPADVDRVTGDCGIEISATFAAFHGEDYSSMQAIAATGGLMPDEHVEARLDYLRRVSAFNVALGVPLLAVHVGTVPPDSGSEDYRKLAARTARAADLLAGNDLRLLLETGRESARALADFIDAVGRPNVAVNYDPGNLLLYGTDDPVRAVTTLRERIEHVHLKDALASDRPGETWGSECTLGSGQASIARVVSKLRSGGYTGPLVVERTAGRGDPGTLADSIDYLRSLLE